MKIGGVKFYDLGWMVENEGFFKLRLEDGKGLRLYNGKCKMKDWGWRIEDGVLGIEDSEKGWMIEVGGLF